MIINVGVSNRHVHLTKETFKKLFGHEEITKRNDLKQIGEYASEFTLTLKTNKSIIENVRVLGPFREYDQVEISLTDAYKLGVKPPIRASGDVLKSERITLVGQKEEVNLENGLIIAERHVHMNQEIANKLNFVNNQAVAIKIEGLKRGVIEAFVKISDNGVLELHLDTDDANAFMLNNGDEVEMICGE